MSSEPQDVNRARCRFICNDPCRSVARVYSHSMRAVLAGGGTGGHVIPALAIAQELRARFAADALFVGTQHGLETRLVPAAGFPLRFVQVGALKRVSLATRVKT